MSNYLTGYDAFEKAIDRSAIDRGGLHFRSARLKHLISAIDDYIYFPDPGNLEDVTRSFDDWRLHDPKEFGNRSPGVLDDFVKELQEACRKKHVHYGADAPAESEEGAFSTPPAVVRNRHQDLPYWASWFSEIQIQREEISRHGKLKKAGRAGAKVATAGITAAQAGAGQAGMAGLMVGGAVTSATGVGLIATSAALSLVQVGLALRSAVSTHEHMIALSKLYHSRNDPLLVQYCQVKEGAGQRQDQVHELVAEHILPYIYWQKHTKESRKIATGFLPVLGGMAVTGVTATKNVISRIRGTLGVNRYKAAHWVAAHFCESECLFTDILVSCLYGAEDMKRLHRSYDYEETAGLLALKMKSI